MEALSSNSSEDSRKRSNSSVPAKKFPVLSSDSSKTSVRSSKLSGLVPNARVLGNGARAPDLSSIRPKPSLTKSVVTSHPKSSSTGVPEVLTVAVPNRLENGASVNGKKVVPSVSVPPLSGRADSSLTVDSTRKLSVKLSSPSSSVSSSGRSSLSRVPSSVSSPRAVTSSFKPGSTSLVNKGSSLSGQRKSSTPSTRDSRLMMLPKVDVKAGDELRLDLRGHRVRSLGATGLNLSTNLEFVYLRDNLLSSLEGIEILKRVKVLDLSFNDFKGPGFEPLGYCSALQQLYLAGNQVTSLASLPQLPNLEFLSVAQNRLKSLSMASQPRLQVLAASKNKISTLKDFPHLPALEHLRVEENPILKMTHLEAAFLLLVGPSLKKFNNRDLSPEELKIAKLYPAHTALCIRDGWEFCRPELAAESTFSFLVEQWKDHLPPGYMLKEASIDHPSEEDACHCHFSFVNLSSDSDLHLKYQWYLGERSSNNFVAVADAGGEVYWPRREDIGKILKVECTPMLNEHEYNSVYAISLPVSPGTGYPRVLNVKVHGELVEGNVIKGLAEVAWCGGTPGKGVSSWLRRRWNSSPVVIVGAEDEEYRLTVDDIDSSLVFMFTPVTEEGSKGEAQYAMTDFIKAAAPSVSNLQILGDAVEENTVKGVGEYFGGKEGPSKFEWLRENKETGGFILVSSGTTEYTLTKEDVGRRMTFVYIPTNFEGQEGKSESVMTEIIKKAPPKVTNLKITGDLREGNKVTVSAIVSGGTEGSSRVQWFKTSTSKLEGEIGLEAVSTSKIAKVFRLPLGAVGYYIVAKFTPMAPDGETGEPSYVISEKVVETLPPSLNFLSVTGDYCEGEMLTASYGYIGGHEGKSLYSWYLHETETDAGVLVPEASVLQYHIAKDAIGKFISFKCTPVRDDGTFGEPRVSIGKERVRPGTPRLLSLQILGEGIEGTTLIAEKKYWGGEEGDSVFRWFLTTTDDSQNEIKGATTASYTLSFSDIGSFVSVSCEPVRSDWARGPIMLAPQIGPVTPGLPTCQSLEFHGSMVEGHRLSFISLYSGGERGDCNQEWFRLKSNGTKEKVTADDFLDLTLEDVGRRIELVYTPVRNDGLKGSPKKITSNIVAPADPKGIRLDIPSCFQDKKVLPIKSYYGGTEGIGKYIWYRTRVKLEELELVDIATANEVIVVGKTLMYTPSLDDVGSYLSLHWVPMRADGKAGEPLIAISDDPVMAANPVVSDVCLKDIGSGVYAGEGKYYGGHEGSSMYSWHRETEEGSIILISGATSTAYKVTDSDYNCRLLFGYTPVSSNSVVGELKLSEPSDVILPELLKIEILSFNGKEAEGETLTAVGIIPESETQQHIWENYKKEVKYQWFYSMGLGENQSFEPLPSHQSSSYKLRLEDIGRCLRCEYTVTDVFGRSSGPVSAVTAPILPGVPKIGKLEIEGSGFHSNLYAVHGIYSGGKEGKSKIQWLRSMVGSPDLISIPGEIGRTYEANVDDVGYKLVAVYTPIREDGMVGEPSSASTEPISVEPDVYTEVKQKLDSGSVKFEVLYDKDGSSKKVQGMGNLEKRMLEVNGKRVKVVKPGSKTSFPTTEIRGSYAPPFHVELFRHDQQRIKIVVDGENEVDLMVQNRHMRDVIALVIRGFARRFNSTSLNSLLKIDNIKQA
ncbi:187-kDa microtubule-associated protein AIR9 [Iris pallida]|uniref:187-kDa microtubule-associated protein AIR9 n=1 Tax=Iris pallida TaxID=29817 RepID=A0AAX6F9J7_IRIPA|nr:187-kDa microtubule-associated protein AIR9 [Iris pallida]